MSSMNMDTHFYMMYSKDKYCFYLAYYIYILRFMTRSFFFYLSKMYIYTNNILEEENI